MDRAKNVIKIRCADAFKLQSSVGQTSTSGKFAKLNNIIINRRNQQVFFRNDGIIRFYLKIVINDYKVRHDRNQLKHQRKNV